MKFIYLHGFASGPGSRKAAHFRHVFERAGLELEVPDLAEGDFEQLTITRQVRHISRLVGNGPARLIGSSLGGYLAALYAAGNDNVDRLALLAPAFGFVQRWPERLGPREFAAWDRTGFLETYHYGEQRMRRISYRLYEDALQYPAYPEVRQPTLIFHGSRDEVVPADYSHRFVQRHRGAELHILDSDHELLDRLDDIATQTLAFLTA